MKFQILNFYMTFYSIINRNTDILPFHKIYYRPVLPKITFCNDKCSIAILPNTVATHYIWLLGI